MADVKRWHMIGQGDCEMADAATFECEPGTYVLASDYDALAAECEALRKAVGMVMATNVFDGHAGNQGLANNACAICNAFDALYAASRLALPASVTTGEK